MQANSTDHISRIKVKVTVCQCVSCLTRCLTCAPCAAVGLLASWTDGAVEHWWGGEGSNEGFTVQPARGSSNSQGEACVRSPSFPAMFASWTELEHGWPADRLAAAAGCMDGQQSDSAPRVSHLKAPGCEVLGTRLAPRLSARSITYASPTSFAPLVNDASSQ